ncbi:MAG: glycosyltransferase family 2 protein [Clostridium sp.]|nr:glycosyltransferase family 2 protein [Clostridium sp.]MCM1540480.1 glycosyltransferase family 2 protein [Blautia sp.]
MKNVSVIVPIYNSAATLRTCLDSILCQSFQEYEIILVDDGSEDGSFQVCQQYAKQDSRIRIFKKENGGVSSARNFGIEKAQGDYLFFLDSDDYIPPQYLYSMVSAMSNKKGREEPVSTFCFFTADDDIEDEKLECLGRDRLGYNDALKLYCEGLLNPPWNKLFDRKIVMDYKIRFPESISLGEDLLFNIAYIQTKEIDEYIVLRGLNYFYRKQNRNSLTQKFHPDYFETQNTLYKCLRELAYDIRASSQDMELLEEQYGNFLFGTLKYNMRKDNPKGFFQKISDNNHIMRMEAFRSWIRKHQCQYKAFVAKVYLSGNYFLVWCMQIVLDVYIDIRYGKKGRGRMREDDRRE